MNNYLYINGQYITTVDELRECFRREEARQYGTDLFNELRDYFIDDDIDGFLRFLGEDDLADRVARINRNQSDPELMRQLIEAIITDGSARVDFELDAYLELVEADIKPTEAGRLMASMTLKTLKKANILVDCVIKQGPVQKHNQISLNGIKGEIHKIDMDANDKGHEVVFLVNGIEIKRMLPFPGLVVPVNNVCFTLRLVKGGNFQMGATQEQGNDASVHEIVRSVRLKDFHICVTPVTQEQWRAVMANNSNPSRFKGDRRPVTNVTYQECLLFVKKLNSMTGMVFRLPTEEEWEYAAREGNAKCNYKFSGGNDIDKVAWYHENSSNVTHDVAGKEPNNLGIYDMSGNVWEWCSSNYCEFGSNKSGTCFSGYKVTKGGCATSTAKGCRTSRRYRCEENHLSNYLGFRLAI